MITSYEFIKSILDNVSDNIAVIDENGEIVYVNGSWDSFGQSNLSVPESIGVGVNYLDICDQSAKTGDEYAIEAANGIRKVIGKRTDLFELEYPCHSPDERRWFSMNVNTFNHQNQAYFVVSHRNITLRKLAEEKVLKLSNTDELTGLSNRRFFKPFFQDEWNRCKRQQQPLSLLIIDLDFFKQINDTYGHSMGDKILAEIGELLHSYAKRPGDLCARYGGDEFVILLGNTTLEDAVNLANQLLNEIRTLRIVDKAQEKIITLTATIGAASINPNRNDNPDSLFKLADKRLYCAKENGKNQIVYDC